MNIRGVTRRIVIRYFCIQTVETLVFILILVVVRQWIRFPLWLFVGLCVLWMSKDFILFPFVWRAYDWDSREYPNPMIGMCGMVSERIDPEGLVRVRGELWMARLSGEGHAIEKGESVTVVGMDGLTLLVESKGSSL